MKSSVAFENITTKTFVANELAFLDERTDLAVISMVAMGLPRQYL